jgi:hypothetical protein
MNKNRVIVIEGLYDPNFKRGPLLQLKGPFDREAIDGVIRKHNPYTFTPESLERSGGARFLANSESAAVEMVGRLNLELEPYGFLIEYSAEST